MSFAIINGYRWHFGVIFKIHCFMTLFLGRLLFLKFLNSIAHDACLQCLIQMVGLENTHTVTASRK